MPLALSSAGDTVVIRKINGQDDLRQHLTELGFIIGDKVSVVSELAGNLILQVKDSRIAINRGTASHIMVDPCWHEEMKLLNHTCAGSREHVH